jgi:hypothetical protein
VPRFIAIPVSQGDAFYLDYGGWSVLVDGGRNRFGFAGIFQNATQGDGVDVAVCSHNDADHANGILGLLEAGLKCDEVWLPGRWLGVLPDVLKPFVEVFAQLAQEIIDDKALSGVEPEEQGFSSIEAYADTLPDRPEKGENDGPPVGEHGWPKPYVEMLEQAEPWEPGLWTGPWTFRDWLRLGFPYAIHGRLGLRGVQLLWSAIKAAHRIRAIATEAFHRGIPVRWFEFDTVSPSGGTAAFQPINSRAIARVCSRFGRVVNWLALTVSNRESLVFWSPPTDQRPGALFTADSDLSGVKLPVDLRNAIATAPHHGSEANRDAYAAIAQAAQQYSSSITWVRSDGRYRSRPGPSYLALSSRRLCTQCRLSGGMSSSKQAVNLFSRAGAWTRHRNTVECSCQ